MAKGIYKVLGKDHPIFETGWIISTHKTSRKVMDQGKKISRKEKVTKTKK